MSQLDLVRNHLITSGSITSWDAIKYWRCTRLSEYIRQLRCEGMDIFSEWQSNNGKIWVNYRLRKEL